MPWGGYVAWFFGGVFLVNAVPHFVSGVMGRPFQSPFGAPPGKGLSSSTTNVVWGSINLAAAYGLIYHVGAFDLRALDDAVSLGAGVFVFALVLARYFGRFHGGNSPEDSRTK
jgi:hypothetical protein